MQLPLNIDWQQILLHLFNFLILAGGLYLLLYKPVKQFMEKREETYRTMDEQAKEKQQQAAEKEKQAAARLAQLNAEIAQKNSDAAQQAQQAAQQILDEANAEKARIITAAQKAAEQEKTRILSQAGKELETLAMQAVEKAAAEANGRNALDDFLDKAEAAQNKKED